MNPSFVSGALKSGWLHFVGMVVVTSAFWQSGFTKLFDFAGAQGEMAHFNLNPPVFFAIGTIIIQLGGSALMIFGKRLAWIGDVRERLRPTAHLPLLFVHFFE